MSEVDELIAIWEAKQSEVERLISYIQEKEEQIESHLPTSFYSSSPLAPSSLGEKDERRPHLHN